MLHREFGEFDMNSRHRCLSQEELAAEVVGRRAVICMPNDHIDGGILAAAADCEIFANFSVDSDNIDVAKATRRGILVATTPGVLTHAVADLAWGLLLACSRRILEGDILVRSGRWRGWGPKVLLGADIYGQTLGIIGAGRVGTTVALRSRGWDMNVLYVDREPNRKLEAEVDATRVSLEVLLRQSDFVSLHVPCNEKTRRIIGTDQFAAMKDSAILINTSNGELVDEGALVEALKRGYIAGAGLDTPANEPRLAPGLGELDNVILTPHIGSATVRSRGMMSELVANAVVRALGGTVAPNVINPKAWSHRT
jgi:glyoxylate reductase